MIRLTNILNEANETPGERARKDAAAKGLVYMGFGRWGADGTVTHKSDQSGRLIPVQAAPAQDRPRRPAVSRSPDGDRGNKLPLARDPAGSYGNPTMSTGPLPKSTSPRPVEKTDDQKWGDLLLNRNKLEGDPAMADKLEDFDDRIRLIALKEPPTDPRLQRYLVNRNLMQDPEDVSLGDPEVNAPRDASGASHFGTDN